MKLIAGLGNPGKDYEATRHNAGFRVADLLRARWEFPAFKKWQKSELSKGRVGKEDVLLLKPQTFMNLSGDAVLEAVQFYKLNPMEDLIVVHDELDLPLGEVRLQKNISSAGHNGIKSVIERIGHQEFMRVRVGIGKPLDQTPVEDYVVQMFRSEEKEAAESATARAADEIEKIIYN